MDHPPIQSSSPLRAVVAGTGAMARHHLKILSGFDHVEVVGLADPSSRARAEASEVLGRGDLAEASSLEELLEEVDADAAHICTPMETHAELTSLALRQGCHAYVEKPVALSEAELEELLATAHSAGRSICAGHQALFEAPYEGLLKALPAFGEPVHVESYFSFRPARTRGDGRAPLPPMEQLVDVLPHPTYLLADLLARATGDGGEARIAALEVKEAGTAHALVRAGGVTGTLVATLEGRPVEHRLRVVGTNGLIEADFVRGTVTRLPGPGSSAGAKALLPFRLSNQLCVGTARALSGRALGRGGSYPGLRKSLRAFYDSIHDGLPSPTSPAQIRVTVKVCEAVKRALEVEGSGPEVVGEASPSPEILVTGGTGVLGRQVVRQLAERGVGVRSVSRRLPSRGRRVAGVEYRVADLGEEVPGGLLEGIHTVVHAAAETSGGWEAHRRNTVDATRNLLHAAADAGVETFVHVSTVAVQGTKSRERPICDHDPVLVAPEELGPYVWGKAESERWARASARRLGVRLKVVRPVPLIEDGASAPPGRLGRRVGRLYVAVGAPGEPLVVAEASAAARAVVAAALKPGDVPDVMNLAPADPPTRRELVARLTEYHPEVRVAWLPRVALHPISWLGVGLQKLLRPRAPALRLASAFESVRYEPGAAADWMAGRQEVAGPSEVQRAS